MDQQTVFMVLGFILALYAVIGNDALQTIGTFMASNRKMKWWILASAASLVMMLTLSWSWATNDGDISYHRLDQVPLPDQFTFWYCIPPLVLVLLTYFGFPVSTTFLVISLFATGGVIQQMVTKSIIGFGIAAMASYAAWFCLSVFLDEHKNPEGNHDTRKYWVVGQWLATCYLWSVWLMHDMANIAVFLPRRLSGSEFFLVLLATTACIFFIFWKGGGKIQKIVTSKTNTKFVRSATLIDVAYAIVLYIFKEYNNIPMSTTWVFVGLLAGREMAIARHHTKKKHFNMIFPMLAKDFAKVMFGLLVSLLVAYLIRYFNP